MSSIQQTRLSKCVSYLQQCQLYECANAVSKAAGLVNCYQHGQPVKGKFSHNVNGKLCEALFVMNSDPNCDTRNIKHVRSLLEAYREMNDLPSHNYDLPEVPSMPAHVTDEVGMEDDYYNDDYEDDFVDDEEPEVVIEVEDDYDIDEMDDCSVEDCILDMVDRGGYLSYEQLCDEMAECDEDEVEIMDALKELVRTGHFEVTSRNPYTGAIDQVLRIS